jgi:hypothetical protein
VNGLICSTQTLINKSFFTPSDYQPFVVLDILLTFCFFFDGPRLHHRSHQVFRHQNAALNFVDCIFIIAVHIDKVIIFLGSLKISAVAIVGVLGFVAPLSLSVVPASAMGCCCLLLIFLFSAGMAARFFFCKASIRSRLETAFVGAFSLSPSSSESSKKPFPSSSSLSASVIVVSVDCV